ncbi:MAG: hypothetical protein J6B89_01790 [Bacilli bacterium]|nr:hypothetical protein [Bacilli bacterium]
MRENKIVIICTIFLLIALVGLSYAVLNVSLDIKGHMKMATASWDVHFENLQNGILNGTARELQRPIISDDTTSILNLNVKLFAPTDSAYYFFDVKNSGDLDAEISSVQITEPVCRGTGDTAVSDSSMVCDNIGFDVVYADNSIINIGDLLNKGESKRLKLRLYYTGTNLPYNEVDISNLNVAIVYSQR